MSKIDTSATSPETAIYDRLKRDITLGELAPDTPLVEAQLASRYRVSRTPVREALSRLEHDGLVERTGRSMRVRQRTPEEIYELYEVRKVLECATATAAAGRRTSVDLVRLQDLVEQMAKPQPLLTERTRLNRGFHAALWTASHNSVLVETLERLYSRSVPGLITTLADDARWTETVEEHRRLVAAIDAGDAEAASETMALHIQTARDIHLRTALG